MNDSPDEVNLNDRTEVELLLTVLHSLEDAVSAIDMDGTFIYWNAAAAKLYGYTAEEVVGRKVADLFEGPWVNEMLPSLAAFANGESVVAFETTRVGKDGRELEVSTRFSPMRTPDGDLVGIATVARDISDQRELERDRAALSRKLGEIEALIAERTAADIHDGPLQSLIAASLRLGLVERAAEPRIARNVASIGQAVSESIEQLRSISFDVSPPPLDVGGLLQVLREYFERFHELGSGIELAFDDRSRSALSVLETKALYRVGREAVVNAVKHANASHIAISLVEDDSGLSFTVNDDGVGMETISSPSGHRGISDMRASVEYLGGTIEVTSEVGRGTTVTAWIPRT
jgi:PAS domain S-box-containing protein